MINDRNDFRLHNNMHVHIFWHAVVVVDRIEEEVPSSSSSSSRAAVRRRERLRETENKNERPNQRLVQQVRAFVVRTRKRIYLYI